MPRPGDAVCVRRRTWRVRNVRGFDDCHLVSLASVDGERERRVLAPFDTIEPIPAAPAPRFVSPQRWRHALRAVLTSAAPPQAIRSALDSRIELLPHQLEPALAIGRGLGSRLLLADAVGLGKTIQAALVLAELRDRSWVDRALILTPAGLRDQWAGELADRFRIDAVVLDSLELRRRAAELPVGLNPWSTVPIAIASIDFVKRPEVLFAIRSCRWDLLIVDEAHNAGAGTDRYRAIELLAAQASFVALLTATPHHGDRPQFRSLCALGAHGDDILAFRRTRSGVGLAGRRSVRVLSVRSSATERRLHALLADLNRSALASAAGDKREAVWLALAVLTKRACSSARSLLTTVERRLTATSHAAAEPWQPEIPLLFDGDTDTADEAPSLATPLFSDGRREREALEAIAEAARLAARAESKLAGLNRLLRRIAERVVIFTEFRDTLLHLRSAVPVPAAILHGGLTRQERAAAIDSFVSGSARVLFATDAAGEGLNLHEASRVVINFELPWNPMRLEQRIGRVDRIGQRRAVHAIHFVGRDTGEVRILERLRSRIAAANADIASADPFQSDDDELAIAETVVGKRTDPGDATMSAGATADPPAPLRFVSLRAEACAEADRIAELRRIASGRGRVRIADPDRTLIACAKTPATRRALGGRAILLVRAAAQTTTGELVESAAVPISIEWPERADRRRIEAFFEAIAPDLVRRVDAALSGWHERVESAHRAAIDTRLRRQRAIAAALVRAADSIQAGLFDRRADRDHAADATAAALSVAERDRAIRHLEAQSILCWPAPTIALVLVP